MEYQRLNDAQSAAAELLKETESYKGACQRVFRGKKRQNSDGGIKLW